MGTKTKRTYNISPETVATVKHLVEVRRLARSQDALVERAIQDLWRRVRDADDAKLWAQSQSDEVFQNEIRELEAGFETDNLRAWEP